MRQQVTHRNPEEQEADRVTASLAGLAVALALVVGGLYLIGELRQKGAVEDCLMAGRANCDQLLQAH